jgi:hypothetical protein
MNNLTEMRHTKSVSLRDGVDLIIRPIRPKDASGLQMLLSRLTPEPVYFRFFASSGFSTTLVSHSTQPQIRHLGAQDEPRFESAKV